ncbi:putative dual specificity protein kinase TTK isoform X2 [Penaeus vannamei]|uniref:Putative dual specificity protein kinase TTK isoform X2 n=1 Tax=Penaeus vannamei TaxID=6689 RepID=A0A3R7MAH1_PENVA|nr:putative dual specificity protein kinase TTK isoform X2 [Penaeus vannamei]
MEEEEKWDEGPTVEDVLSSVLKSKSKFGKIKLSLPPLPPRRTTFHVKEPSRDDFPRTKTEELQSLLHGKKTNSDEGSSAQVNIGELKPKEISGRVSPQNRERLNPNNFGRHHLSMSSSKILRSVSTPEMRDKSSFKAAVGVTAAETVKPAASRQMNFSEMPQSKHANKENTNPILSCHTLEGKCSNTLESVFKDMQNTKFQSLLADDFNLGGAKAAKEYSFEVSNTGETVKALLERDIFCDSKPVVSQKDPLKSDHFLKSIDTKVVKNSDQLNLSQKSLFPKCSQTPNQKTVPQTTVPLSSSHSKVSPDSASGRGTQSSAPSQKAFLTSSVTATPRPVSTTRFSELSQKSEAQQNKEVPVVAHRNVSSEEISARAGLAKDSADLAHAKHSSAVPQQSVVSQVHHNAAQSALSSHSSTADEYRQPKISKVPQTNQPAPQGTTTKNKSPSATGEMKFKETPVINRTQSRQFQTPSGQMLRAMPPTPPTKQKLQQMDHIVVNDQEYLKLGLVGRGGSSKVYEVLDLETRKVKAIKLVELEGVDEATLHSYKNEIDILNRLQWSDKVIQLYDYELTDIYLKLVMEKGNRDLASILNSARGKNAKPISPFTIQHYWQGMLLAVQAIHQEGIIHSDLKPANFLLVNETVKLIDFGIASSIQQDMTSVIKDSQAGTFNYMSPESLMDVHSGPIINGRSGDRPTIKRKRPSISELLEHPYLTAKPGEGETPQKEPHLKSMLQQLSQLTPNSLSKITSMMQQMQSSDSKPEF